MSKQKLIQTSQLRKKSPKELLKLLQETQLSKSQDALAMITKRSKNVNLLKPSKITIARIKTVLAEKRELAKLEVASNTGKTKTKND
ncbi:hypothetical protein A2313_02355 [Candidatus Roizmanbacteria bacterium RIFOXYB2_FULL_41_10]|uniref:Large ribosomal subunit protein uL29 n=1 Tax=Candidatus Roizmanbacteria bacterium RIFOXYA1_FULL_41_12 TaxID=1802082 RepID=A0A1F7K980_9BACT|nr:MAG: hypothetical protein A2209_03830 [Candidatus Roizmanbacteria bacterium RIFOXYA1_FULL_41_12]OGK67870.1 MAG: hypothetical protein A2377_02100 [Candidatus Roizmanbacteria bacterium RIFOXYB1_FULL_41_27]OGK69207.1 MAG: hypothetical protein A2313_02355 [Candidatus Roizmanbacteria bacterium RIFOXYB2_FULL_41_10]OGK72020.1 MAG: hypothetical protein A2403_03635 [Candidatus Roizmanbacteria bacterium RIFOXYC1_FULL_41_16]OGK73000.1 MAG: hypothetical protein A2459_00945 [Candidatus Roizmanbacteria ba